MWHENGPTAASLERILPASSIIEYSLSFFVDPGDFLAFMSISIKTADDIAGMRIAGKLAAEVLDFITPYVKAGITTGELDRLCHEYMVDVQQSIPAPLNYCPPGYTPYPKAICT